MSVTEPQVDGTGDTISLADGDENKLKKGDKVQYKKNNDTEIDGLTNGAFYKVKGIVPGTSKMELVPGTTAYASIDSEPMQLDFTEHLIQYNYVDNIHTSGCYSSVGSGPMHRTTQFNWTMFLN